MKILNFESECSPKFNTRIMRAITSLMMSYETSIPSSWRAIIELQRKGETEPYYLLDICGESGGGPSGANLMAALRRFPYNAHTDYHLLQSLLNDLREIGLDKSHPDLYNNLVKSKYVNNISRNLYWELEKCTELSPRYGGIRVPYEIWVTKKKAKRKKKQKKAQDINDLVFTAGEIRVVFVGEKDWQNIFMAFSIMRDIQKIMAKTWKRDQILFNTNDLAQADDPQITFVHQMLPLITCPR